MSTKQSPLSKNDGKLGLLHSTTILIGGMIGSAIFSLSGVTIMNAGPASIISWVVAAVILFVYGLQTAELATIFPHSGGIFTFPEKSLGKTKKQGRFWGWFSTWAYLFGCIGGGAFSCMYVAIYMNVGFENFTGQINPSIIAVAAAIFCGALNLMKFSLTGKANTILTSGLFVTLIIFIVVAISSGQWDASLLLPFFSQGTGGSLGFVDMIPTAMVAYGSIVATAFMVGEIRNPTRTVPKAMAIAMIVVVGLYLLVILAVLGLVSAGFLIENPGMTYIPLYAAAFTKLSHIPWLVQLISIAAVLALITTVLVVIALAVRGIQAAANAGILPASLGKTSEKTQSPVNATILVSAVIAIISAFPDLTELVVNFGALCNAVVIAIVCITVVSARKKFPGVRKFTAPGGNILPIITFAVILITYIPGIISGNWMLWAVTGCYFAIGLVIFLFSEHRRKDNA